MPDPHDLVERVRELSEHAEEPTHELRLRDRPPPMRSQQERLHDASTDNPAEPSPPSDDGRRSAAT